MNFTQVHESNGERTFVLIFEKGDEVMHDLQMFAQEQNLAGSHFTAIGAFSDAVISWFDYDQRQYRKMPIAEQVEVLTLAGDIATKDGQPSVHAHVVLGRIRRHDARRSSAQSARPANPGGGAYGISSPPPAHGAR